MSDMAVRRPAHKSSGTRAARGASCLPKVPRNLTEAERENMLVLKSALAQGRECAGGPRLGGVALLDGDADGRGRHTFTARHVGTHVLVGAVGLGAHRQYALAVALGTARA